LSGIGQLYKTVEIKVLLTIFAWWWKDPDPYIWLTDLDPGGPKIYGSGSGTLCINCLLLQLFFVHFKTLKHFAISNNSTCAVVSFILVMQLKSQGRSLTGSVYATKNVMLVLQHWWTVCCLKGPYVANTHWADLIWPVGPFKAWSKNIVTLSFLSDRL
jgi:hypothetical protein